MAMEYLLIFVNLLLVDINIYFKLSNVKNYFV